MIYADHAATTPMKEAALHVLQEASRELWGNPSSLYALGQKASEALYQARARAAKCIGAKPEEVIFTGGGSEADNQAILSAARILGKKGKKHILSTKFEHHAVLHTLKKLEREGFEIELLEVGEKGVLGGQAVARRLREDTALVSVMYANNEIGTIQPIAEIGKICRDRGVLFHVDGVQAVGHIPVDVAADHVDYLALSGHKFGGPKGVGALYVRRGAPVLPLIEGGAQEKGRRGGTENLPGILAMTAALEESVEKLPETGVKVGKLRDKLIENLSKIPHSALNGDPVHRLPGNVSFCFEGIEGESLLLLLDDKGICASSGSACTSGSLDPSHVLLAIGRPHEVAHGSLRLTLGEENTEEEVEYISQAVAEIVDYLRGMSPLWKDKISGKKAFVI